MRLLKAVITGCRSPERPPGLRLIVQGAPEAAVGAVSTYERATAGAQTRPSIDTFLTHRKTTPCHKSFISTEQIVHVD
jgi:hypothetical protein